jgi:ferrous iron transport protein A
MPLTKTKGKRTLLRMNLNNTHPDSVLSLADLLPGQSAEIVQLSSVPTAQAYLNRLLEMGFVPGVIIRLMNQAPLGKDPISVQIHDGVYAIRREEAQWIQIKNVLDIKKSRPQTDSK